MLPPNLLYSFGGFMFVFVHNKSTKMQFYKITLRGLKYQHKETLTRQLRSYYSPFNGFCWSCDEGPLICYEKFAEPLIYHYGSNGPTLASQFEWLVNTFKFRLRCLISFLLWDLFSDVLIKFFRPLSVLRDGPLEGLGRKIEPNTFSIGLNRTPNGVNFLYGTQVIFRLPACKVNTNGIF
jgi:hypothetical protein